MVRKKGAKKMKFDLLKNTAYIAIISCSLGLVGCAATDEEDLDMFYVPEPVCTEDATGQCVTITDSQTALYLPEKSVKTYTVTTNIPVANKPQPQVYYGSQNGTDLSSSAPDKEDVRAVQVTVEPVIPAPVPAEVKTITVETVEVTEPVTTTVEPKEVEQPEIQEPEVQTEVVPEPQEIPATEPVVEEEKTVTVLTEEPKTTTELQIQSTQTTTKVIEVEQEKTTSLTTKDTSLTARVSYGEKCHDWTATTGDTLRGLLTKWGEMAGWTVIWKLDRDYHLEAGVIFRGTYTEVSSALIRSFARATPAPIGTFYKGNRVLVINTQEDENAN